MSLGGSHQHLQHQKSNLNSQLPQPHNGSQSKSNSNLMLKPYYKDHFTTWIETLKSNQSKLLRDIRNRSKNKLKSTKSK